MIGVLGELGSAGVSAFIGLEKSFINYNFLDRIML